MKLFVVLVMDIFGGIARVENDPIDWSSKEDKEHFKEITMEAGTIIMGRKTFESIGRPLPGRLNVVLTTKNYEDYDNVIFLKGSPEDIIQQLEEREIRTAAIIGGAKVVKEFFPYVDTIYITIEPLILENSLKLDLPITRKLKLESIAVLNERGALLLKYQVKKDK
ncbi:dihydrofolate reductase [Thermosipho ferrireducens]|uniref:dihydrofolate reductase n=1 Tax=Thermosipho ferrireducens TaxID=2571116 RepID=A0ABX7SAE4_9BACT|nr:dihydrofolate reductase [Thermosipho ferrireducens]QTA38388.1 dihydrofolate reductase [Thermosipho ferrireducens]